MGAASVRRRSIVLAAAAGTFVLVMHSSSAMTGAEVGGQARLPQLWALEVGTTANSLGVPQLRNDRAHGINAIVADAARLTKPQLARARTNARSAKVLLLEPVQLDPSRGRPAPPVQTARRACAAVHRQARVCTVITRRPASALAVARTGVADVVALRLASAQDVPAEALLRTPTRVGATSRLLVLVPLTATPTFDEQAWTRAIGAASASAALDLGVTPTGPSGSQALSSYLGLLSAQLTAPAPTPPDATPPSVPAGLVVTSSTLTTVTVAWQPSTDSGSGVAGYLVSHDGTAVRTVTDTTAVFESLPCGTTVKVSVQAVDRAGNQSAPATTTAATLSCATAAGPPPQPPPPPPPPPPSPTANLWIDQNGGTCVRQAPAAAYQDATACGGFQVALDAAQPGDTVLIVCTSGTSCTYPPEELTGDRGASARVTFAPAPGNAVSFEEGTGSGTQVFLNDLHHVTFQNIGFGHNNSGDATANLRIDCTRDVTLFNSSGRRFYMFEGNAHITFQGGDWGNYGGANEEDSTMGTTGGSGPTETCPGDSGPQPQTNILFDGVTWHDVLYMNNLAGCTGPQGSCVEWGASHPDCFEINGYVDGVTIQNSTFYHCGNTMLSLYTDQGDIDNVTAQHNVFRDMAPTSYYGIQWVDNAGHKCNSDQFLNNTFTPNAPTAWNPNTPPRFECATSSTGTLVSGNTFQEGPPPTDCATDTVAPYFTLWQNNTFPPPPGSSCP